MGFTRLSDAELRRLVHDEGEQGPGAREELLRRHHQAVIAFAQAAAPSAGDELAERAWEQALRPLDEDITGAMRPRALAAVLRTAADWLTGERRSALAPQLVDFFEPDDASGGDAGGGPAPAGAAAGPDAATGADRLARARASSLTARAFELLAERSQTVLWHQEVEHDDPATLEQLLGEGPEDVSLLNRRARRELYNTYVSLHQETTVDDDCRRLHRMLLAYAEQTSMNTPGDLVDHLDRCAHCARAVDDLERMRFEFGAVLAESLLPWGGADYALAAHTVSSATFEVPAPSAAERPVAAAGAAGTASGTQAGRRLLRDVRSGLLAVPGAAGLTSGGRGPRARRLVLSAALVGLCSLVVAVAYTGGLHQGEDSAAPRPGNTSPAPVPPPGDEPTATATSTVTATRSPSGKPPGNGFEPDPAVRGAALEWLFGKVADGVTPDSSGNGVDGTLDGDPRPQQAGGAMEFSGEQSVVSDGPVVDTSKSFSVSARAKLDGTEDFQTVVSQDASNISGFSLQYDPEAERWEMITPEEDEQDGDLIQAGSETEPQAGEWTYLTGVHDADAGELRLYVNGKLEDTVSTEGVEGEEGSASSTTTTTTTTSGGGFGSDGGGFGGGGPGGGDGGFRGGGGGFSGGGGGFGGRFSVESSAKNAAAQGFASGPGGVGRFAGDIIRKTTRSLDGAFRLIAADGNFAVGRGLAGEEFVRGFDGTIDDVRAFKRALTAEEAAALAGR